MEVAVSAPSTSRDDEYITDAIHSDEEDPDEYPFPLTLRTKRAGPGSPLDGVTLNGN